MRTFDLAPLYRSTVGFDRLFSMLDGFESAPGYPPYNIERVTNAGGETDRLRITLAVAGFTRDQLEITLEDHQLTVRGKQHEEKSREFLYRGIAARQFTRTFVLAEGIEVELADLSNGLLAIDLKRLEPERSMRTIEIGDRKSRS
ncbi:MAG: Hsp20 family protein [Hyphomicrobiaceae bacterium]|nr:Hsp20 family protein [Hyphomicrobiaceae bacterium]